MVSSAVPVFIDGRAVYLTPGSSVTHSSVAAGWSEEVVAERWSLSPMEWPEHVMARHRLVVVIDAHPAFAAWSEDGIMREAACAPGAVHVVPQGAATQARWLAHWTAAAVEFSTTLMERLLEGRAPAPSETLDLRRNVRDQVAYGLTHGIMTELAMPTERLYGEMLCLALAVHLLQRYGRTDVEGARFKGRLSPIQARRVLDSIHANLDASLSVSALAREAGLSDACFARAFRATFNEPPHRLILRWRLERAARLVRTQGLRLADAAIAAGFCDQAHFTNSMRRHFGTTPGSLLGH